MSIQKHLFKLLYFLAISNMIGKLFTGWFSDISWVDPFSLFNSYVVLSGATVCFLPLCTSYGQFAVVVALYGFFTSFFMLKTIVLVELFGLENLTSAYRWLPFVKSNLHNLIKWRVKDYFSQKVATFKTRSFLWQSIVKNLSI